MKASKKKYRVACYSLDGKLFKVYESARKASLSRHAHPRSIDKVIRGERTTAFGYMWRRFPVNEIPENIPPLEITKKSRKAKAIAKVDERGKIIKKYPSIKQASIEENIDTHSLRDHLNKKTKHVRGLTFQYLD